MTIDIGSLTPGQVARLQGCISRGSAKSCWPWSGPTVNGGYGQFTVGAGRRGLARREQAHRVVYKLLVGSIPDGLVLDHLCRNPPCVNPAHLEPVTPRINTLRGVGRSARNALASSCPVGHPYDSDNTRIERAGRARRCRACEQARWVRRRAEQRRVRELNPRPPKTHCKRGHEYTPENTRIRPLGRSCRQCHRESARRRQATP